MHARLATCLVLALVLAGVGTSSPAAGVVLDRPVPGRVLVAFDAPTRFGPGHRGVDLAAPLDSPVRAAAAGRVVFAGRVVDAIWVTVDHGALRTTVGPLRALRVVRGERVRRGEVVGTSGRARGRRPAVHWSARRGDTYVDPLGAGVAVATLVPSPRTGASASGVPWLRVR